MLIYVAKNVFIFNTKEGGIGSPCSELSVRWKSKHSSWRYIAAHRRIKRIDSRATSAYIGITSYERFVEDWFLEHRYAVRESSLEAGTNRLRHRFVVDSERILNGIFSEIVTSLSTVVRFYDGVSFTRLEFHENYCAITFAVNGPCDFRSLLRNRLFHERTIARQKLRSPVAKIWFSGFSSWGTRRASLQCASYGSSDLFVPKTS